MSDRGALDRLIAAELDKKVMSEARALSDELVRQAGDQAMAVLFYGSCLRTGDGQGLMDFYVLVKDSRGYSQNPLGRLAHRLAPPHVRYVKASQTGPLVHAKVSVMTLSRFVALCQPQALDVSIWARFAQPCALLFARDTQTRTRLEGAIHDALTTAITWSTALGPKQGQPRDYWQALFRATYGAELRIDEPGRADQIVALDEARYQRLFRPALEAAGVAHALSPPDHFQIERSRGQRLAQAWRWAGCVLFSKTINLARIIKGAVTFDGRTDYVAWKLERRLDVSLELTPWQRNHPLLSAPQILAQMWRKGAFRRPS